MKFKRFFLVILLLALILTTTITSAAVQSQEDYTDIVARLKFLGIINDKDLGSGGDMSRELFAKIIINATGNNELALSLEDISTFQDVPGGSEYCGFINAAAKLGYLTAYADGKFKPKAAINFGQLCTATVMALGYTSEDISGAWPKGYVDKAKSLGITYGYSLSANSTVSVNTAIIVINRTLNTNTKKANAQTADQSLADAAGLLDNADAWIYGNPEVALNFNPNTRKLGRISFQSGIPILRDYVNNSVSPAQKVVGEAISLNDIKDKDIVYEVYNKLNKLMYYLVVDNKIEGEVTSILPNKYSPKKVQINGIDYELGDYVRINKFSSSLGSFNVGDSVTLLLGYDNKGVEAYYSDNSEVGDYAFVVNTYTEVSKSAADYGKVHYKVDLMHVDGTTKSYIVNEDPNQYKWKLVKYSLVSDTSVALMNISYITSREVEVDRYEKKIEHSYITDNVKIFNYTDSSVSLLKWADLPDGTLPAGKVQYLGTTGEFGDVNIILTSDVLNQQFKNYVVQKIAVPDGKKSTTYTYTLVSGGDTYSYSSRTEVPGAVVGTVFNMKMYNNKVSSFNQIANPDGQGWYVQAIDSKRIKMNEWVYMFNPDITLYVKDYSENLTAKKITDINVGTTAPYGNIKLYCDRPINNGGKVQLIVFSLK